MNIEFSGLSKVGKIFSSISCGKTNYNKKPKITKNEKSSLTKQLHNPDLYNLNYRKKSFYSISSNNNLTENEDKSKFETVYERKEKILNYNNNLKNKIKPFHVMHCKRVLESSKVKQYSERFNYYNSSTQNFRNHFYQPKYSSIESKPYYAKFGYSNNIIKKDELDIVYQDNLQKEAKSNMKIVLKLQKKRIQINKNSIDKNTINLEVDNNIKFENLQQKIKTLFINSIEKLNLNNLNLPEKKALSTISFQDEPLKLGKIDTEYKIHTNNLSLIGVKTRPNHNTIGDESRTIKENELGHKDSTVFNEYLISDIELKKTLPILNNIKIKKPKRFSFIQNVKNNQIYSNENQISNSTFLLNRKKIKSFNFQLERSQRN